ncbi:MAG: hypothetical protein C4340_07070 [Armatimonadota bacterium]
MHCLHIYELVPNYLERRGEWRAEHLKLAWQAHERGELLLAGALAELLLFQGDSAEPAERFARSNPYVLNGLVKTWKVRAWTTVVGDQATTPVHPDA